MIERAINIMTTKRKEQQRLTYHSTFKNNGKKITKTAQKKGKKR